MILFAVLMTSSPASGDWELVPTEWTSSRPGYWGEIEDGRDTLAALKTAREEATAWKKAYYASEARRVEFEKNISKRFDGMEDSLAVREKAHKKEVRSAKAPGFGVFIGYGVDQRGNGTAAVGVGLVWKF